MQPAPITALFLAVTSMAVAACGGDAMVTRGAADADAPTVVATTGIAADIVANVGGDDVRVVQLVPDGSNPHSYAPSAREQEELEGADLVVLFSPLLEEGLPLDRAAATFAFADHARERRDFGDGSHTLEEESGGEGEAGHAHEERSRDPHLWMDPTQIEAALPALAAALARIDPAHAKGFERRAAAYGRELAVLDDELRRRARNVPPENRKLVTSHDLMGYFGDRYGFDVVGAPFGASPEAEASAAGVAELIREVRAQGVSTVFAQEGDDPEVLRRIADEAGVVVVDDILVESLNEEAPTYVEMLRFSGGRIADALGG